MSASRAIQNPKSHANALLLCAEKQCKLLVTMSVPVEKQDSRLMRAMFGSIAPRYDFVTRILSYGMDRRWKRLGVKRAALPENAVVLDLAAGTGDFSRLVRERLPDARSIALDITEPMLRLARAQGLDEAVCGDATALPFADATFDCVFIGYGLRNFPNLKTAVAEIARVTRPGGLMVSLDFFLPPNTVFREMYLAYLYAQGAVWGIALHGNARTYSYISASLRSFVSIQDLSALLQRTGYAKVDTRGFILGGIALHWATKELV
jgi:demethylmenaquinone methyltransferase / 2-methoxy-6-polyprenyl-1,4-benzoquinol methylase